MELMEPGNTPTTQTKSTSEAGVRVRARATLSHIATSIVSPAGRDKTTQIEPHRNCGKGNVAIKGCIYSQL